MAMAMKLRARLDLFSTTLLSALTATQLVACGGSAVVPGGGSAGSSTIGGASTGGASTGGSSAAGSAQGGAASGGTVGSAGAGANKYPCENPKDLGGGLIQCTGFKHRLAVASCVSHVPRPEPVPNPDMTGPCKVDADCTDKPYGWCGSGGEIGGTYCNYGCVNDSDCSTDSLCECAEPVGRCVHAQCTSAADCQPGFLCREYDQSGGCAQTNYRCQSPADTCGSCSAEAGGLCGFDDAAQAFICRFESCAIGRPFLVDGVERLAPVATRADWSELSLLPSLTHMTALLRTRLSEQWTRIALMEHASIAAFARFSLQLLSLGAPASLIESATAAMADETKHAKACFALASRYAAMPLGPGRLSVERSLDESSLAEIVLITIREGCVGETVAAIEAREAAEHASDPAVRELLLQISEDETRHAELAYRFVSWALSLGGVQLERAVQREFEALAAQAPPVHDALTDADHDLLRHGIIPEGMRSAIREQAMAEVIWPCSRALFRAEARQSQYVSSSL